ncbi:MAG TPA: phosphoribosylglycinamide synthetase C domain-containing protein [bacterium]|jgi:phosphoribosylamine--glycine ligase|nr:phosphoribosylglycinamide synthetase C domain-containing protein [bacterium]HOG38627.1 phosphoribosylglycinamide synthetase C domain-containing protein [bacterium]HQI03457.1 phosphoribosylglycinamide synthetase C domain-containing protein [bacterium]
MTNANGNSLEPYSKKKFLFITISALVCDIARIIFNEGNDVKFFTSEASQKDIGDGFVPKIDNWEKEVDWADVIIFDDVLGQGSIAEELRKKGKYVIGGTKYTDMLEDDRSFGQEELKKFGVPILPYQIFNSCESAIEFVKNNPAKYVIKDTQNNDETFENNSFHTQEQYKNIKKFLFVGDEESGQDIIQVLEAYSKIAHNMGFFQLQKKVNGVEVAVGAFFNGNEFLYPINVNFEHKKLFPGNIGPSTGEMGTSMFWSMPNKIFNLTLKKLEKKLAEEHYVGYIDINCIVNGNGIYPLEFTTRFGYPTIFIQQEGITMPMGEFFYRLAKGEKFEIKTKKGFQVGVRIIMPPYPFDDVPTFNLYSKEAIIIFKKKNYEGVHTEDAKLLNGEWVVAGDNGVVLTITGSGPSMKQAQAQAYNRVDNILIPNMYYRKDIGDRWFEDSDKLHTWGYLREF